jgi:septal ring factor EnvC (AmiA/AmiB activator)
VAGLLVLASAGPGGAQERIDSYENQARQVDRQIEEKKAEAAAFSKEEKACIARLHQADRALAETGKRAAALENDLDALATAVEETRGWIADLERRIDHTETYAARRMAALYKMQCLGRMSFLATAGSVTDFFRRKTALRNILDHDEAVLVRLGQEKAELAGALKDLEARKEEKQAAEQRYHQQMEALARKKAARRALLAEVRGRKRLALAAVDSLRKSAEELEGKIKRLQCRELKEKTAEPPSSGPFAALKGLLKMPVEGRIISTFGRYRNEEFNVVNFQSGIDIKAGKGTPIRAVREGRVLFSSWFKGYGNLLIVDHGESYYTLYAHADDVYKREGDPVRTGETIATVGDTGSLKGPMLHFEIRHHGKPMDPLKWLKNG